MVLVQKWPFFQLFFQAIQARKMSFTIFQNEKTPFQAIKTRSLKSQKIDIFPKGLTHGFGPKMAIFPTFFLSNISQENVFCDILERKNAFLGYKNNKFKKSKNWFRSKNGHFSTSFWARQARKTSFAIFYHEESSYQAIKTTTLKSPKIDIFSKGLTHGFCPKMGIFQHFSFRQ